MPVARNVWQQGVLDSPARQPEKGSWRHKTQPEHQIAVGRGRAAAVQVTGQNVERPVRPLLDIPQAPVLLLQQRLEPDHPPRIGRIENDPVERFPAQPGEEQRAGSRPRRDERRAAGRPGLGVPALLGW